MMTTRDPIEELTAKFLQTCGEAGESEQRVIDRLTKRLHMSRNARRPCSTSTASGPRGIVVDVSGIDGGCTGSVP